MSTFRLYLWKEWREQRTALFALALLLPALVTLIGYQLPRRLATSTTFVAVVTALSVVLMLVVVGGELLGGERRRELVWLERLPRGLGAAFPAKLFVFVGTTAMALVAGFALAFGVTQLRGGAFGGSFQPSRDLQHVLLTVGCAVAVAPWVFSASAWCPRGPLAFAGGALLALGLAFPLFAFDHFGYQPEVWELVAGSTLFLAGALVSAWVGFNRQRLGASLGSVCLRGGGCGVLALVPFWPWAGVQLQARDAIVLGSEDCLLGVAWVSEDARVALLEVQVDSPRWRHPVPSRALWIDLEHGKFHELPLEWPTFWREGLATERSASGYASFSVRSEDGCLAFEARTGEPVNGEGLPSEPVHFEAAGHGWSYYDDEYERVFIDPYSGLELGESELGISWGDEVYIGPRGWLIHDTEWQEYDPATARLEPANWLASVISGIELLPDGRLFARLDSDEFVLADPATRVIEAVHSRPILDRLELLDEELQGEHERYFGGEEGLYRLDLTCRELVPLDATYEGYLERRLADGDLILVTDDGFVRREADDGSRHVIVRFEDLHQSEVMP